MRFNQNRFFSLSLFVLYGFITIGTTVWAREVEEAMQWNMVAEKSAYAPGEPVLLNIQITNPSEQDGEIWFGSDGLNAFSFKIKDAKGEILQQAGKIERLGLTRWGFVKIPARQFRVKCVVLNQWCSTLLPYGKYTIVCSIEPKYVPENKPNEEAPLRAQILPTVDLECSLELTEVAMTDFNQIIANLTSKAFQDVHTREGVQERSLAREMLSFTESPLAVTYQLEVLEYWQSTWLARDVIEQLVKSNTLKAAQGLVKILEEEKKTPAKYLKREIVEGVYRLRDKGDPNIINATSEFVSKHPRGQ